MSVFDWSEEVPDRLEFNYVEGTELVCYDPDEDEEVRLSKREVLQEFA